MLRALLELGEAGQPRPAGLGQRVPDFQQRRVVGLDDERVVGGQGAPSSAEPSGTTPASGMST